MSRISGYEILLNAEGREWKPSNSGSVATAKKNRRNYRMKLYKRYPVREGFSERSYNEAMAECKRIFNHLTELHGRLKRADGGSGRLAFANEIVDNKNGTDPGIIEVVPFVEGARALTSLTGVGARLKLLESLADALVRIHSVNVRHGDLKLENALCVMHGTEPRAVIIDFDRSSMDGVVPHPDDVGGTDGYIPPEVFDYKVIEDDQDEALMAKMQSRITDKSDVFALGMMFYRILTDEIPRSVNFAYVIDMGHPAVQEAYLNELIRAMTAQNPDDRPGAEMVLQTLQEKCFADNLPAFDDVWEDHAGYRFRDVSAFGRRVTRIRRAVLGDALSYAVTYEGFPPRTYNFSMMKAIGLLVADPEAGENPPNPSPYERPRVSPVKVGDIIEGYRIEGEGFMPEDRGVYKLNNQRMVDNGYEKIWHAVDVNSDKRMYVLIKTDNTCHVRSKRLLLMQQLIQPR